MTRHSACLPLVLADPRLNECLVWLLVGFRGESRNDLTALMWGEWGVCVCSGPVCDSFVFYGGFLCFLHSFA